MVGNNIWITESCIPVSDDSAQEYPQYNDTSPEKLNNKGCVNGEETEPFQKHSARLMNHLALSQNSNGYMDDVSNKNKDTLRFSLRTVSFKIK